MDLDQILGDRWQIVGSLGAGGQGEVYKVLDTKKVQLVETQALFARVFAKRDFNEFKQLLSQMQLFTSDESYGAAKISKKLDVSGDSHRTTKRFQREIEALTSVSHPALLPLIDSDPDYGWYVSPFYAQGPLTQHLERTKGNVAQALALLRPLVEGLATLHTSDIVHRDIKPHNVFVKADGSLVLGDFGLQFDPTAERISNTIGNVGSRDWMPPWAFGRRVDVKPSFDVYSLGKLLWSMVSGNEFMQLWYFNREDYDLEVSFPDKPEMALLNQLLGKCIVEQTHQCLPDASALLAEIDDLQKRIALNASDLADPRQRLCRVCGIGHYEYVFGDHRDHIVNFGINPTGAKTVRVYACNHCGHADLFYFRSMPAPPPAWTGKS